MNAVAQSAGVEASHVLLDDPGKRLGEAVAEAVKLWGADLVVVGSHGRRDTGQGDRSLLTGCQAQCQQ